MSAGSPPQSAWSPFAKARECASVSGSSRHFSFENVNSDRCVVKEKGAVHPPPFRVSATHPKDRSRQPADMERLDLEIFLDPELGSFTSQSRLLDTAERRNLGRDQAGVQADHAEFQRFCNTP